MDNAIEQLTSAGSARRALWGVYAVEQKSGNVVADVNGTRMFVPASNRKLVTAAMTTAAFEPDATFVTEARSAAPPVGGGIAGDLVIVPTGDPSWSAQLLEGRNGTTKLRELAAGIAKAGVSRVDGDLVIDCGRFEDPEPLPPGWIWDELAANYAPRPSALSLNQNLIGVVIEPGSVGSPAKARFSSGGEPATLINNSITTAAGSVPTLNVIRSLEGDTITLTGGLPAGTPSGTRALPAGNPLEIAADAFMEALKRENVAVSGKVRVERRSPQAKHLLASVSGARISTILTMCMRESDNFLAESLYLLAGAERTGRVSYRSARQAEANYWKKIGIGADEYRAVDGSGLSREDHVSPRALVALLRERRETEWFVESLPVSGVNGTLRYRLSDKGLARRVKAKTGTLDGVSSLAGYIEAPSGRVITFAVIANNYTTSTAGIRKTIDDIVAMLATR